ncbi:MAG: DNA metabolism protein [Sulfurospirillum sp.]|nr:MAG: DNA metabolism protein [Sulfurospirillum sp.]
MTYLYDGSFEGFLTLIHRSYMHREAPHRIIKSEGDVHLFDTTVTVITNRTYALKVLQSLKERFEKRYFNRIFHTFLCDTRDFEKALYDYTILGFRDQKNLADITHPSIRYIEALEQEYFRYLHKMYGFVRFEELEDGTLYARLEGKFNILPLLGKHFAKRLDGCNFVLHDLQRSWAYMHNGTSGMLHEVKSYDIPRLSSHEEKFQKLWKTFFHTLSIPERKNLKLQRSWVPLLYRRYMTEFG